MNFFTSHSPSLCSHLRKICMCLVINPPDSSFFIRTHNPGCDNNLGGKCKIFHLSSYRYLCSRSLLKQTPILRKHSFNN
ncbi:hypothetical protein D915_004474 [Fasciola hepatica]|uniref:Uncharacterized protein n=1 Tax=Fasciola hepatica TaxID=6192 RepID=A0A4E0S1G7_FASHE|nr:hypothetical protein D915_004474 [Fasciola hepatica]